MAQVRGNLLNITGSLMKLYPDAQKQADNVLFKETGKHLDQISVEDWVEAKIWDSFMGAYSAASITGENSLLTLGRNIYPAIKRAGQIPENIDTPLKTLKFEGDGFLLYHKGPDVKPRCFLRLQEGDVLVQAPSPGYNCKVIEGVFLGIVEMFKISTVKVKQTKCIKLGDITCEYNITW